MYGYHAIHAYPENHLGSATLLSIWSLDLPGYACAAVRKKIGVQARRTICSWIALCMLTVRMCKLWKAPFASMRYHRQRTACRYNSGVRILAAHQSERQEEATGAQSTDAHAAANSSGGRADGCPADE